MILDKDEDGHIISRCKECIFAVMEQTQPWHKTQTGCRFNRPDKFKRRGTKVEWVEGDSCSSNEIHVFCNNIRDKVWLENEKLTLEEAEKRVRKDNTIKWTAIVYSTKCNIEEIKSTVLNIAKSTLKPEKIMVSVFGEINFVELVHQVRQLSLSTPTFFNRVLDNKYPKYIIDYPVSQIETEYYLAIEAGYVIDYNLIEDLDCWINNDCRLISLAKNEDSSVVFTSRLIHKFLRGHEELESSETGEIISELSDKIIKSNPEYKSTILEL